MIIVFHPLIRCIESCPALTTSVLGEESIILVIASITSLFDSFPQASSILIVLIFFSVSIVEIPSIFNFESMVSICLFTNFKTSAIFCFFLCRFVLYYQDNFPSGVHILLVIERLSGFI